MANLPTGAREPEPHTKNGQLSPAMRRFCECLVTGCKSIREAAGVMGVSQWTLYKWNRRTDVQAYIAELERERETLVLARLRRRAPQVAERLVRIALGERPAHSQQVRSATTVLDRVLPKGGRELTVDAIADLKKGHLRYRVRYEGQDEEPQTELGTTLLEPEDDA